VAEGGAARAYDEEVAALAMREDPVRLGLRLRAGTSRGWVWTCDLTRGYVDINAHYRS
jgi:glutamate N-acetyltransferase/amino-acid N-acetyltransferase